MQKQTPFTIYNASAGSGKTYTLVQDYLKILFTSNSLLTFRNILALTFTNKAVGEMKERIIDTLKTFSDASILSSSNSMFETIAKDLNLEPKGLHEKSKLLLHTMVHNYAAFDISTIDKFNHKLIRTFAHDLKLPVDFEVELDTKNMLGKAVDKLIEKAGSDKELTKVLVDFAIEKTDDDKSWDISYDFNTIAELLINENEIPYIDQLKDKTLNDFNALKTNLQKQYRTHSDQVVEVAKKTLELISQSQIEHADFSSSYLPKHFIKLADGNFNVSFAPKWQNDLLEGFPIYPKKVSDDVGETIEGIRQQLIDAFHETKNAVFQIKFLKNALNNITPLSVLGAIKKTLDELKLEDNLLLISEFNAIINNEIREQPTPFIYERIGEKFKHYFIDEFQDTSELQWENLIPLVDSAITGQNLKGETGTAMIVGDAKQAIYRWRGGRAEQFIDLYSEGNPFHIDKTVENLPSNYRSYKRIVEFNNTFFSHISSFAFSNEQHQHIYKNAHQELVFENEGYVELSFLNIDDEDKNELQCDAVLNRIEKAQQNGFALKDICIIVRRKKEGIAIAEYLSSKHYSIISSETLMLKNSPEVNFIVHLLTLAIQPKNDEIKIELLSYLAEYKLSLDDKHAFFSQLIHNDIFNLFKALKDFGYTFDFNRFLQLPIYEAIESIIRQFNLNASSNAYIQFFLDEVLDYSQKYNTSLSGFLEFWDRKKESLSIVSPQGENAVQIMTIHKSKGLEFPVVIFPYANQNIYFDLNPKVWIPVEKDNFNGFSHLYLNQNKDLKDYNETSNTIYNDYQSELELDSINLLYVVLTRAIEHLYIISELDLDKKTQTEKLKHYSGLFINYLKTTNHWNDNTLTYSFGNPIKTSEKQKETHNTIYQNEFISTAKEEHNLNIVTSSGYLWNTLQEKAIEKGNLIHDIMSEIKTIDDVEHVLKGFENLGKVNTLQYDELKVTVYDIINHSQLQPYFNSEHTIYNEQDIMTKEGYLLRPDRVVINAKNEAVIIDYKTGLTNPIHQEQLYDYQLVLEDMNFKVIKKILIYINDVITIKEF
ncbi:UvrD-helicase domain-containing protein [Psychroserpens ponticola]|uniref:DNA 3'-5' helicase n=1 Tax=Psychroserpens ponticola TaxID=2932268 RepID=A0ABY7RYN2_9FLAO|nr:UvrD-helicase domain-containing protein [Psychroserpens ponticola]WCO01805.1 UvrD-helicase domain-containing protein [Psychroserpens ponticola]